MARCVWPFAFAAFILLPLAGCGWIERAERPAWRSQAENVCLAKGLVKFSAFVEPQPEISGPGICGLTHPFKVSALADGAVRLDKSVTIDCPMISALEDWLATSVQPAAMARLGSPIVGIEAFGAYSCRSIDNMAGARLSEHAFGNAFDVAGFKLADGREIVIVRDWKKSDTQESAFLHEVQAGACGRFTTVLGPGADAFHYNHFHLDLAMHGATDSGPRRYCKPLPAPNLSPPPARPDGLPPAPDVEEPQDVARLRAAPRFSAGPLALHGPDGALPPPLETFADKPAPPLLPEEWRAEVDNRPTSSVTVSQDD